MKHQHITSQGGPILVMATRPFPHVGLSTSNGRDSIIIPIKGTIAPVTSYIARSSDATIYNGPDAGQFGEKLTAYFVQQATEKARGVVERITESGEQKKKARRPSLRSLFGGFGFDSLFGGLGEGNGPELAVMEPLFIAKGVNPLPDNTFKLTKKENVGSGGSNAQWVIEAGEDTSDDLLLFLELDDAHADSTLAGTATVIAQAKVRNEAGDNVTCAAIHFKKGQILDAASRHDGNKRFTWNGEKLETETFSLAEWNIFRSVFEPASSELVGAH